MLKISKRQKTSLGKKGRETVWPDCWHYLNLGYFMHLVLKTYIYNNIQFWYTVMCYISLKTEDFACFTVDWIIKSIVHIQYDISIVL